MMPRWSILSLVLLMASGCCFGGTSGVPTPPAIGTAPAVPGATAPGGTVTIAPGFMPDPQISTGAAGGPIAANTMSPDCRGNIPAQPSLILNATGAFANLRILASSNADTTLVVQRADGTFLCNDDSDGLNPAVQGAFGPGEHRIWVGTWMSSAAGTPYTLGITELPTINAAALAAAAVPAGPPVAPVVRTGTLGPGDRQLQSGEYQDSFEFQWNAGQRVQIDCTGDFDNYLILRRPSGTQVDNDDTNGLDAQIIETLTETGTYTVIVTTYAPGQGGSYTLSIR